MMYKVKIRLKGRVSWIEVPAADAAQARALVLAQYDGVTVLQTKRM